MQSLVMRYMCRLTGWKVCFFAVSAISLLMIACYILYDGHTRRIELQRASVAHNFSQLSLVPTLEPTLFLLILVPSSPTNFERRDMIRKTWANATSLRLTTGKDFAEKLNWKVIFVLGRRSPDIDTKVVNEARENGDILIVDFQDSYQNLVVKTLTGFSWAMTVNCSYVLKADDDVYVRAPRLLKWLSNSHLPLRLYAGHVHYKAAPRRNTESKYFVGENTYNRRYYPPYCGGPFYILSTNILADILQASRQYSLLSIEDAYMGILAESIRVTPLEINSKFWLYFSFGESEFLQLTVCDFASLISIGHQLSPSLIQSLHRKFEAVEVLELDYMCFWWYYYPPLLLFGIFNTLIVAACIICKFYKLCGTLNSTQLWHVVSEQ